MRACENYTTNVKGIASNQHVSGYMYQFRLFTLMYEACSKNTRSEVIKNVLYLEVTCLGPFQSTLLPNSHLSQRCFHFLEWSWYGSFVMAFSSFIAFALISEIIWNLLLLRVFLKFWEQEKVIRSKVTWVGGVGKNSYRVFDHKLTCSECWVDWSFVVMEKLVVTFPQFWPSTSDGVS